MYSSSYVSKLLDVAIYVILALFALATTLPFIHIIASSFASERLVLTSTFLLIPTEFSLSAYRFIFATDTLPRSLIVTVFITVAGTAINIMLTSFTAYPLSKPNLRFRSLVMFLVVFTMLFGGGMIPNFLLVKELGMLNTFWSLLIPGAISAFNLIILKNFFQGIPKALEESAKMDGCNDVMLMFRIVMPLSMPALATLTLFYAVGHWNTFMNAILYINDSTKWPIQVLLRQIVLLSAGGVGDGSIPGNVDVESPPETVKLAVITVAVVPILLVYPFLQKHFAKGVLLGSVKG